jgi:ribosome maturation protein Sdo1
VDAIHKLLVGPQKVDDTDYDYLSLLAIDEIYSNHLGEQSGSQELETAFGTTDKKEIVKQIIIHGKYQ